MAPKTSISARANATWGQDRDHHYVEKPPLPSRIMVEISNGCNHACVFCANPLMTRKIGRIDPILMDKIMNEARAGGCEEIGFYTTGEPLVHKQLDAFVARASQLGFSYIYISTNGALATPERMRRLVDAGLHSVKFSINAGSRETYAKVHGKDDWDKVIENLKSLSEYRKGLDRELRLFVSFVITKIVEHEVDSFREMIDPFVDEVMTVPCNNQTGNMMSALSILAPDAPAEMGDSGFCPLPFMRLHVTCEGYLTLCCTDYQNYLAVADLNAQSLLEAWSGDEFVAARRRHLENHLTGTLCGNCWLGRWDQIQPLRANLASEISYADFYEEQSAIVRKRAS